MLLDYKNVVNPFQSPAILSFCPGILGLERGLKRAIGSIRVVAYVEIEAFIIANLLAGMEAGILDPAPVWTDAKTFDAQPFCGRVHGIIGGYPCPGESLAGLREGHLYKGFLWPALRKAIAAAKPIWCFFENVDDHLTGTYPIVQRSLRNMGYRTEAGIYSASECGASIEAQRLFILAVDETYVTRLRGDLFGKISVRNFQCKSKTMGEANNESGNSNERNVWNESDRTSETLGQAINSRLQKQRIKGIQFSRINNYTSPESWPMAQGPEQYKWEEPRTIESSVGYTIERYNFREDLLRANGNMVPEQQAELAFIDLMHKHGLQYLLD